MRHEHEDGQHDEGVGTQLEATRRHLKDQHGLDLSSGLLGSYVVVHDDAHQQERQKGKTGAQEAAQAVDDRLAKLLAFRYAVPRIDGESGWRALTGTQREDWRLEAQMVEGYLVHGVGWTKP